MRTCFVGAPLLQSLRPAVAEHQCLGDDVLTTVFCRTRYLPSFADLRLLGSRIDYVRIRVSSRRSELIQFNTLLMSVITSFPVSEATSEGGAEAWPIARFHRAL